MKKKLKTLFKFSLLLSATLCCLAYVLLYTNIGLKVDLYLARYFLNDKFSSQSVSGSINKLKVKQLSYQDKSIKVSLNQFQLNWSIIKSLYKGINISQLSLDSANIKLQPTTASQAPKTSKPIAIPSIRQYLKSLKQLTFNIDNLKLNKVAINIEGTRYLLKDVILSAQANKQRLFIKQLRGNFNGTAFKVSGQINHQDNSQTKLTISSHGIITSTTQLIGDKNEHYQAKVKLSSPVAASLAANFDALGYVKAQIHYKKSQLSIVGRNDYKLTGTLWPTELHASLSPLRTHLDINAQLSAANQSGHITIAAGFFNLADGDRIHFKQSSLNINHSNHALTIAGQLLMDGQKKLTLDIALPHFLKEPIDKQTIDGKFKLKLNNIAFIDKFITDIKNSRGIFNGAFQLSGRLLSPKLNSQFIIENGRTFIKALGIQLEKIHLNCHGPLASLNFQGSAHSGNGAIKLSGSSHIAENAFSNQLIIHGEHFQLFNTDEYQIDINPNIQLNHNNNKLFLKGELLIPKAMIKPHDFSSTVELPEDVVIIGKQHQRSQSLALGYQAKVLLGEQVDVAVMGLKGQLQGSLELDAPFDQPTKASGIIKLVNADYHAYGQNLTVSKGNFIYSGGPLNNPGLYVEAIRQFQYQSQSNGAVSQPFDSNYAAADAFSNKMTVGINISGTLKSPKTKLFSVPSGQSQADILSMLILGRSTSQATGANDSQLLLSALSSLNLGNGSSGMQLTEQLQHAFGLDSLGIETISSYNAEQDTVTDSSALVLEKALSAKLSLNYSVALSGANNILRIKYQFSPSWAFQIETSGNANGFDMIYHKSKK